MKTEKRPKGIPEQGNSLAEAKSKSFFFFFFWLHWVFVAVTGLPLVAESEATL